jgi:hypothetical protein
MKYFMSKQRREKLFELLCRMDDSNDEIALKFTEVPDNLMEVDKALAAHALGVIHFQNQGRAKTAGVGIACLCALMGEAMSRGLAETDFPVSYEIIKADIERMQGGKPHSTIQ